MIASTIFSIISIAFALIGLFGAINENYCLSITYSILWIIGFIINSVKAFIIELCFTCLSVLFVLDLRRMHVYEEI